MGYTMEMVKMQKIVYILAMLAFLSATFLMFAGCEQQYPVPQSPFGTPQIVLRCYTADYCRPCHAEKPYVDAIRATGKITVEIIDVTNDSGTAQQDGITDLPTYRVYINGQLYWQGKSIAPVYRQVVGGG